MNDTKKERARFVSRGTTPPIGYVYTIDHEGQDYNFQTPMRHDLFCKLRKWYADKNLDWPGDEEMEARVEDFICRLVPKGFCIGGPDSPRVPFLSVRAIRDATRLFFDKVRRGQGFMVSLDEANQRAKVCANCPKNLHGICTSCAGNEFQDLFIWFIRNHRRSLYDDALDTCSVCGCLLKAKVHVSVDTLSKLEPHTYPENCWLFNTAAHCPKKGDKNEQE